MTPTQRTLKLFRDRGYTCAVTERWNPFAKIRQDLFTFIDVLALGNGQMIGIQTTSASNHAKRREKILATPEARDWIAAGGEVLIVSWKKPKGKRSWEAREEYLFEADFTLTEVKDELAA